MEATRFWKRTSALYLRGFALGSLVIGALILLLFFWRVVGYRGPQRAVIIWEIGLVAVCYLLVWRRALQVERNPRSMIQMGWWVLSLSVFHAAAVIVLFDTSLKTFNLLMIVVACPLIFPFTGHYALATLVCFLAWLATLVWVKPFHLEIWAVAWATAFALGFGIHLFIKRLLGDLENFQLRDHRLLRDKTRLVLELRAALASVEALEGLIPICAQCKKVRNDGGYWEQVEVFINSQTGRQLTHGYCPECHAKAREELEALKADWVVPTKD